MAVERAMIVDVGSVAVEFRTGDATLARMLERRFRRFLNPGSEPAFRFHVFVLPPASFETGADLRVSAKDGGWVMERGDFRAEWDLAERRGRVWQTASPYAIDSVLRIVHTLVLAADGGFLLHASSAVRDGRAFLFTGPSGSGKSTIVGLAPGDVTVLTDEISYVKRTDAGYRAYGTPFAGELSDAGKPVDAPVGALFRLGRGADDRHVRLETAEAVQTLMRNILFFANDARLVRSVLDTACDFASCVPAFRLCFAPTPRVWSTIQ